MTNKEEYIRLCAENDDIPVFMQPWWLDAVCAGKEWDVLLSREDSSNPESAKILGAMPYLLRKKWGMRYIVMPQQTQLGGIVVFDDRQQGDLMLGDTRIATAVCQDIKQQLDAIHWPCWVNQYSNTVFFRRPLPEIVRKYTLAQGYDDRFGGELAHVVVMQHVTKEKIDQFIKELKH